MATVSPRQLNERPCRRLHWPVTAAALLLGALQPVPWHSSLQAIAAESEKSTAHCDQPAQWIVPGGQRSVPHTEVFANLTERKIILLGEAHDNAAHHRWQLHSLAALHGRSKRLVIGFEMFPRRVQPVLDKWVRGELSRKDFLKEADWYRVWGFDPQLYMPLFDFARMHRIPMVALNVERSLISRTGREGWKAIPAKEREGVGDPSPALREYQRSLGQVYVVKQEMQKLKPGAKPPEELEEIEISDEKLSELRKKDDFIHFVEAQLVWDRAMAEALAAASREHSGALVVGIMGTGHIERGFGVPHQLADLGISATAGLAPIETGEDCRETKTGDAEFLFTLEAGEKETTKRLKLGVVLDMKDGRVQVGKVSSGSVAEAAGLQKGDRIVEAAGINIAGIGDLLRILARQAPGTWLPLRIERDKKALDMVAKFAASPQDHPAHPE